MDTLLDVSIERCYWVGDEVLQHLGQLRNLQSITMDRLHMVSARGLTYLFEGEARREMRNIQLSRGMRYANHTQQLIKWMIKKTPKLQCFDFSECEAFNDEMLHMLEDKDALPELREISIRYTACSRVAVQRLKDKRPTLDIDFEENDW